MKDSSSSVIQREFLILHDQISALVTLEQPITTNAAFTFISVDSQSGLLKS